MDPPNPSPTVQPLTFPQLGSQPLHPCGRRGSSGACALSGESERVLGADFKENPRSMLETRVRENVHFRTKSRTRNLLRARATGGGIMTFGGHGTASSVHRVRSGVERSLLQPSHPPFVYQSGKLGTPNCRAISKLGPKCLPFIAAHSTSCGEYTRRN